MAAGNFAALGNVEVKEFDLDGMPFKVQFNPARIVSSGAKVDAARHQGPKMLPLRRKPSGRATRH